MQHVKLQITPCMLLLFAVYVVQRKRNKGPSQVNVFVATINTSDDVNPEALDTEIHGVFSTRHAAFVSVLDEAKSRGLGLYETDITEHTIYD